MFQIESRAQMQALPKARPERFEDLVVQVAIIRPGPGAGETPSIPTCAEEPGGGRATYAHPSLQADPEDTRRDPCTRSR